MVVRYRNSPVIVISNVTHCTGSGKASNSSRERGRYFCVAIVTFTNLTPGLRPSMSHSHSAALPLLLSIPPPLQVSVLFYFIFLWTPLSLSHCLFLFVPLGSFVFFDLAPQTVGLRVVAKCCVVLPKQQVQRCSSAIQNKVSGGTLNTWWRPIEEYFN